MTDDAPVRAAFRQQALWCERLGSPFTARLMRVFAATLDRSTRTGRAILDWPRSADATADAVPLRLAGALNALARAGEPEALVALWPPAPMPDEDALAEAVTSTLAARDDALHGWLARAPQTNEVGRAAVLFAGLVAVADSLRMPLALYEIGASAGLNLLLDRYAYRLGGRAFGDPGSAVRLAPDWEGPPPAGPEPVIAARRGCDIAPLDVTDARERERLLAYVWPDQRTRIERLEAALAIARDAPPVLERADAAEWLERRLPERGEPGVARVLMHSVALQYVSAETRRRIDARMAACGALAHERAPLAWLSFEQYRDRGATLRLTLWPGGTTRALANAQAHGAQVRWFG